MLSQSARATTAREAAFRVAYPNSIARAVKLVALDEKSVPAVRRLAEANARRAALLIPSPDPAGSVNSIKQRLSDFAASVKAMIAEIDPADLVVLVSTAGEDPQLASLIGEACRERRVPVTALILDSETTSDAALSASLARLRPYASMLVVARGHDYVEEMLAALRV
jgi:hypothetical protein